MHTWALDAANTSGTFRNDAITTATSRFGSGWFSKVAGTYSVFTVGPTPATSVVRLQAGDGQGYVNHIFWTDKNLTNPATLDTAQTVTAIKTQTAAVVTTNAVAFRGTLTNVQVRNLAHINSENIVHLGDGAVSTTIHVSAMPLIQIGAGASYPILASGFNAVSDANGLWKTPDSPTLTPASIGALSVDEFAGIPLPFPGTVAPAGFLKCKGQAFNKTTYPILAARYPTGYLPDLRGEFIRGLDDGRGLIVGVCCCLNRAMPSETLREQFRSLMMIRQPTPKPLVAACLAFSLRLSRRFRGRWKSFDDPCCSEI